jgi:hypothetical protein
MTHVSTQATAAAAHARLADVLRVSTLPDLDDLIRQSEMDTGRPGRDFFIGGAERLAYTVRLTPTGYELQRSDSAGFPAVHATRFELGDHVLGHALVEGFLFTTMQ